MSAASSDGDLAAGPFLVNKENLFCFNFTTADNRGALHSGQAASNAPVRPAVPSDPFAHGDKHLLLRQCHRARKESSSERAAKRKGKMKGGISAVTAACFVLSLAGGVAVVASEQFKVGGDEGWRQPDPKNTDMYALWAGRTSFRVGDSIYFEYGNDSVLLVDKRGYYHCNTTNVTAAFHDGRTVFNLDKPGLLYFISGEPGHCKNGQRLIVDVTAPAPSHHRPSPPPLPAPATPAVHAPSQSPLPSAAAGSALVPVLLALVALAHFMVSLWTPRH
ncbi:hypothetical protein Taro_040918 [Colocasia esculenta]|uniref:Phytocyanin domain-containing protein n=1 Tax=Colocasia esculenta TaxID=4460 RepID=A0A843WA59_COLES|nr:hypothetical protein [Colocasia esculenta]